MAEELSLQTKLARKKLKTNLMLLSNASVKIASLLDKKSTVRIKTKNNGGSILAYSLVFAILLGFFWL